MFPILTGDRVMSMERQSAARVIVVMMMLVSNRCQKTTDVV